MPELPEVETVRRGLVPAVEGRRFARVEARRPDLRIPIPPGLDKALLGRRVERIGRRAKYLLFDLDDGSTLILHLGMSGRLYVHAGAPPPAGVHDHVELGFEGGATVVFNDARRFGMIAVCPTDRIDAHPFFAELGPEPLSNAFNGPVLAAALAGKRTPIKAALLDQRVVAGLGNIYVCEALYHAGLSPRRLAHTVQGRRAERLADAVRTVLETAIAAGGSTLRDYVQPSGQLGYFQHGWAVYGREGERCPACDCDPVTGDGIRRIVQSNRSTFYCPARQR